MALDSTPETGAITVDQTVGLPGQAAAPAPEAAREPDEPAPVDQTEDISPFEAEPTAETALNRKR